MEKNFYAWLSILNDSLMESIGIENVCNLSDFIDYDFHAKWEAGSSADSVAIEIEEQIKDLLPI